MNCQVRSSGRFRWEGNALRGTAPCFGLAQSASRGKSSGPTRRGAACCEFRPNYQYDADIIVITLASSTLAGHRLYYSQAMDSKYAESLLLSVAPATPSDLSDPQTILHRIYGAIVQGDFSAFGEHLTDDIELHIHGLGPLDGTWRGRDDVVAATRRNFAALESQKPEVENMIAQGDTVAVLLRESGTIKATGQTYSVRGVQWFTFSNGKIKRIDEIAASIWKVES